VEPGAVQEAWMKVLITGGAGFIGSNFVRRLTFQQPSYEIAVMDKLTYAGSEDNLKGIDKITFIKQDICDKIEGEYDVIINFAAETHVDRSITNPGDFVQSNIVGTYNLLEYARQHDIYRFIQISTDEVYGSTDHNPLSGGSFTENDKLSPSSPYSASKAAADLLTLSYFKTYKLPVLITRSCNNFGPYQYPEKFIPMVISKILSREKIPIYGDGSNIRDWIYVDDNNDAIFTVFQRGVPGEIYNISAGNELTNMDVVNHIIDILPGGKVSFVHDRPGHDFRYSIDSTKIREFGWEPKYSFDLALRMTVWWYCQEYGYHYDD
jgi:dTDP-glucose 4,6-dehydratase